MDNNIPSSVKPSALLIGNADLADCCFFLALSVVSNKKIAKWPWNQVFDSLESFDSGYVKSYVHSRVKALYYGDRHRTFGMDHQNRLTVKNAISKPFGFNWIMKKTPLLRGLLGVSGIMRAKMDFLYK